MLRLLFRAAWPAALLFLAACSTTSPRPSTVATLVEPAPLMLISIDALRADYLGKGDTPNLDRLAGDGVRAEWMNPSYPALTFPNHFTLVTGLRPDHHGVVHNTMRENGLGDFRVADLGAVGDGRWWRAEPIWVGAEKAHLPTAIWAWPGSAAEIDGVRPTRWKPYDESISAARRVDEVAAWLQEPTATRPRFTALYLEMVDDAGHDHGPDAPQTRAAVREVDGAIGRLLDALARNGLLDRINLIVVSDHGMATVAPGHAIAVEEVVPMADAAVISVGQSIGIAPREGRTQAVELRLLGRHDHYRCWRKGELPPQWHYGSNPRVPPIICQMDEGWDALPAATLAKRAPDASRGSHGYDPSLPSMRAAFIAHGPAFRKGVVIPAFDNVDVYPLMIRLLGIPARANDGDIAPLLPALRPMQAM
ncbi:ectonucleotide pyrophosphatase/phosphodiesterase [Pseudoxanthomonas yeongjuensis]|uniref:alkaline phosphatase family protein n=1 Tax=Pseudoxanthomonas yeongjuensis TaxID=377616 RepID=UPI003CCD9F0E